jgi:hypothetical protein
MFAAVGYNSEPRNISPNELSIAIKKKSFGGKVLDL